MLPLLTHLCMILLRTWISLKLAAIILDGLAHQVRTTRLLVMVHNDTLYSGLSSQMTRPLSQQLTTAVRIEFVSSPKYSILGAYSARVSRQREISPRNQSRMVMEQFRPKYVLFIIS